LGSLGSLLGSLGSWWYPGARVCGYPGTQISKCLGTWVPKCLGTRVPKCLGTRPKRLRTQTLGSGPPAPGVTAARFHSRFLRHAFTCPSESTHHGSTRAFGRKCIAHSLALQYSAQCFHLRCLQQALYDFACAFGAKRGAHSLMIAIVGVSQVPLVPNAKRDRFPLEMLRSCRSAFGKSTVRLRLCFHQVTCTSGGRAPEALLAHARHLFFFGEEPCRRQKNSQMAENLLSYKGFSPIFKDFRGLA